MAINDNYVPIAQYRGPVRICENCHNDKLPDPLKPFCKFCQGNRFVAQCLKCDGKGTFSTKAAWDGTSDYSAICDICGGQGSLPAKGPATPSLTPKLGAAGLPDRDRDPE